MALPADRTRAAAPEHPVAGGLRGGIDHALLAVEGAHCVQTLEVHDHQRDVPIDWKAPGDPVTVADREASEFIVSALKREFPDHAVLCEEEPDDLTRLSRSHVWMIDPMDGTREFIENRAEFAVQIGLVVNGTPVLGVVYQPTAKKLYYAAHGLGAFLESNGSVSPLRVSPEQVASRLTITESRLHRSARVQAIRRMPSVLACVPAAGQPGPGRLHCCFGVALSLFAAPLP